MKNRRMRIRGPLVMAFAAALAAGDCPSTPSNETDVAGEWFLRVDVTVANEDCEGDEDAPASTVRADITQTGLVITASAEWTTESGTVALTGARSGSEITFSGSYAEDGGTTITTYTLDLFQQELRGIEEWSWSGPSGASCPDGRSTVFGERG